MLAWTYFEAETQLERTMLTQIQIQTHQQFSFCFLIHNLKANYPPESSHHTVVIWPGDSCRTLMILPQFPRWTAGFVSLQGGRAKHERSREVEATRTTRGFARAECRTDPGHWRGNGKAAGGEACSGEPCARWSKPLFFFKKPSFFAAAQKKRAVRFQRSATEAVPWSLHGTCAATSKGENATPKWESLLK